MEGNCVLLTVEAGGLERYRLGHAFLNAHAGIAPGPRALAAGAVAVLVRDKGRRRAAATIEVLCSRAGRNDGCRGVGVAPRVCTTSGSDRGQRDPGALKS